MNKKQAIEWANSRPRSYQLQFYVIKWNDVYAVVDSAHMSRHPNQVYVYKTKGEKISKFTKL